MRRDHGALLLLPLAFLVAELLLRDHGLPYWLWFNLDPSYIYLIGGLNILQHAPPAQFQHPGVPVQLIVAAVAWLTPAADRLKEAETILTRASDVMLVFDTWILWLMGRRIQRRTGMLLPALFAQLAPFVTMLTLKHGIEVEPEPLLLGATALLVATMVEDSVRPENASLAGMAFAVAFGSACKVTFAPLGLAPLIAMQGNRRRVAYVGLTLVLFAVWMVPEIPNLAPMTAWFTALAKGSGTYGQGPETVVAWATYPHHFAKLFFARPLFLAAFAWGIVALFLGQRGTPGARVLLALLTAQLVQI
ncbi:MAG TPA: glycosyltransferase family 39 protein, partial [Stellaceae bacterium]|nr:glycosyltransferase family 39 protein [Stellaceae bacterium]